MDSDKPISVLIIAVESVYKASRSLIYRLLMHVFFHVIICNMIKIKPVQSKIYHTLLSYIKYIFYNFSGNLIYLHLHSVYVIK